MNSTTVMHRITMFLSVNDGLHTRQWSHRFSKHIAQVCVSALYKSAQRRHCLRTHDCILLLKVSVKKLYRLD